MMESLRVDELLLDLLRPSSNELMAIINTYETCVAQALPVRARTVPILLRNGASLQGASTMRQ